MSTRSGKRIHASFDDDKLKENEDQVILKSEMKTRSKKIKDNEVRVTTTSKLKKRRNYVSYPSVCDETEPETVSNEPVEEVQSDKKARKLRRFTLKEKNLIEPVNDEDTEEIELNDEVETVLENKKFRSTRRNKKTSEITAAPEIEFTDLISTGDASGKKNKIKKARNDIEEVEMPVETKIPVPKSKKSKKKKKGAKSKKVSLENEHHEDKSKNKSITSIDSFHSAAGSPTMSNPEEKGSKIKATVVNAVPNSDHLDHLNIAVKQPSTTIASEGRSKRKGKSSLLQIASNSMDVDDNSNKTLDFSFKNNEETLEEFNKECTAEKNTSTIKKLKAKRKSSLLKDTVKNINVIESCEKKLDSTFDKNEEKSTEVQNSTFDKEPEVKLRTSIRNSEDKRKSSLFKDSFNKTDATYSANTTVDMSEQKSSEVQNATFDKSPVASGKDSITPTEKVNTTFDKISSTSNAVSLNSTYDKDITPKIDTTFDKTDTKAKPSIMSSDNSIITLDKSNENSRISITSDDSKTENIINTTPLLVESSLDESQISESSAKISEDLERKQEKKKILEKTTNEISLPQVTPLKREGTFTKDGPDAIIMSPKPKSSTENTPIKTPTRHMSLPSPGCTPFCGTRSTGEHKHEFNITRSIEKSRRSSMIEEEPQVRQTRVMFCSPVNATTLGTQQKGKIIKSSLKGSNKSFVFNEDLPSTSTRAGARRKRSLTAEAEPPGAKRTRLARDALPPPQPATRLRTNSAIVKPVTPKAVTPSKPKPEPKVPRTKLPNFAALHRKQFAKMESLDECQERKARRAKQLLTPNGNIAVLERASPRVTTEPAKVKETKKETKKPETRKTEGEIPETTKSEAEAAKPMLPTLESLRPGFTRFGFKMNIGVNPFISPIKSASKPKEFKSNRFKREGTLTSLMSSMTGVKKSKPNVLFKQDILPSTAGATTSRKESAKHTVLREKSFSHSGKRDETRMENRTIIKGVRTNRRFELQMQMRNIN